MRKVIAAIVTLVLIAAPFVVWPFTQKYMSELDQRVKETREFWSACPTVQGSVTSAETKEDNDGYHRFTVRFTYQLGNVRYSGAQGWYLEHVPKGEPSGQYTNGKSVTVYYDPAKPKNAVIAPMRLNVMEVSTVGESVTRSLVFPAVFVGCILVWTWACVKQSEQEKKSSIDTSIVERGEGQCGKQR